jgi:FlaA1/EpsC-like NDP-sugar epimerase
MKFDLSPVGIRHFALLLSMIALMVGVFHITDSIMFGLGWILTSALLAGVAVHSRKPQRSLPSGRSNENARTPILIVTDGAGHKEAAQFLQSSPLWTVAGYCAIDQFVAKTKSSSVQHACMLPTQAGYQERRQLLAQASELGVTLWLTERPEAGGESTTRLRRWRIDDVLLGESAEQVDVGVDELLAGKVVLVTGAGGSIGAELCRQIAGHQPSLLVLMELSEFALYSIEQALGDEFPQLQLAAVVCDVKSEVRVQEIIRRFKPEVVFHAAAYKHVPLMEDGNAWEAIRNNVLGTHVMARAAIEFGVGKFVLISTDKAVNPTNVMGASKRLAEMVCQALQQTTPLPKFEMVRFGNVLGSAGSVIPRFAEQIAKGGAVTVTHPDMVRYFMSIPEAARLVLQAGSMGLGGEIFVMDMGKPVRILDIAQDMIRLSERSEKAIPIAFTGLRPGEKLFEELLSDDEHTRATPHPRLRVAKAREVPLHWLPELLAWTSEESGPDEQTLRRDLKKWVPEYASPVRPQLRAISGGLRAR